MSHSNDFESKDDKVWCAFRTAPLLRSWHPPTLRQEAASETSVLHFQQLLPISRHYLTSWNFFLCLLWSKGPLDPCIPFFPCKMDTNVFKSTILQTSSSQTLICKPVTWGSCKNADFDLVVLEWYLGFCISNRVKVTGDASLPGLWTTLRSKVVLDCFLETTYKLENDVQCNSITKNKEEKQVFH